MTETDLVDRLTPQVEAIDKGVKNLGAELLVARVQTKELRKNLQEMLLDFESGEELVCPNLTSAGSCKECGVCQFKARIAARIKIVKQRTGL